MRLISLLLILLALFETAAANAQEAQITLTPTLENGAKGVRVVVRAMISNPGKKPLYLNQVSIVFADSDKLDADPTAFYAYFSRPLAGGAKSATHAAFLVKPTGKPTNATFHGTFSLLGGGTKKSLNRIGQQDFTLTFKAAPHKAPAVSAP